MPTYGSGSSHLCTAGQRHDDRCRIFAFVGAWNDFLWPLIAISDESKYTLTLGMNRLKGMFIQDPRLIAAGALVSLIPIIVFFCCFQRYFFRGLEQGGLKG